TTDTPAPSAVPARIGAIASFTTSGARGRPTSSGIARRRRSKSSGQSAPARLKQAAETSDAAIPASNSASWHAAAIASRAISTLGALWMSEQPERPRPTTVPSGVATSATVFVLPPSTPISIRSLSCHQPCREQVAVCGGQLGVEALGEVDLHDQRIRRERANRVGRRPRPGGLGGQRLVFAE